jgi:hypothetical protein
MKLLESKKFKLPQVFYVTKRERIKEVPIGVPFIFGDARHESTIVRILEYEVLYQEAIKSGFPFNFRQILKDNGYEGLEDLPYHHPIYMEYTSEGIGEDVELKDLKSLKGHSAKFKSFIKDSSVYVDVAKLKHLNVFPVWLESIEKAVHTNIHNFAVYNNNMYNKKLEGMYGSLDLVSPDKNLIIIDISGSIPRGVSSTCLALAKNLASSFYADILITGSKSTVYPYELLTELNIDTIYDENGMDNDQAWFKKLVTTDERTYKTAIVFGDNHSPCYSWSNDYNTGTRCISREDGKKLCKWKIDKLISFHTDGTSNTAGYADWFEPKEVEKIAGWVKYLN